ncbi:serine threonine- kinase pim-3-like protein [Labeo rohita]|uniref:Serine threonine-kinase pim-3-like protein n=1 Tax=Labeo rohita TaxID=84645 RepID=A0A498LFV2_LABRO|nr:serine threonine- kinase pim-3-like protein [Labeo rohita]
MAHMSERPASGRSRSRSAAFTQTAGQEDGTRGSGDQDQDPLPNPNQPPSQELPGYIAPLPSDLAVSVSTDQPQRKRKRQNGSQEDEGPSTSYKRPAKRSRREVYAKGPLLGRGGFGSVHAGIRRSDGLPSLRPSLPCCSRWTSWGIVFMWYHACLRYLFPLVLFRAFHSHGTVRGKSIMMEHHCSPSSSSQLDPVHNIRNLGQHFTWAVPVTSESSLFSFSGSKRKVSVVTVDIVRPFLLVCQSWAPSCTTWSLFRSC